MLESLPCTAEALDFVSWCAPIIPGGSGLPIAQWMRIACETTPWSFVHFMSGFWSMLLLNDFVVTLLLLFLFEAWEAFTFMYTAVAGAVPTELTEASPDSLLGDPFMGFLGILFAIAIIHLFDFPNFGPWPIKIFSFAELYGKTFLQLLLLSWPTATNIINVNFCTFLAMYAANVTIMFWLILYWNWYTSDVFIFERSRYTLRVRAVNWREYELRRASVLRSTRDAYVYRDRDTGKLRVSFAYVFARLWFVWILLIVFAISIIAAWAPFPFVTALHAAVLLAIAVAVRARCFNPPLLAEDTH